MPDNSDAAAKPTLLRPRKPSNSMLVIVDMQDRYPASRSGKLQRAVAAEILAAKASDWWIVVLEFGGTDPHSPTHTTLSKLLAGYDRCLAPLIKNTPDGSRQVRTACRQGLILPRRIRICGVHIGGCVQATVNGLVADHPDTVIEVVKKACNCTSPASSWQCFVKHPRVWIV